MTSKPAVAAMVVSVRSRRYGGVDILVNNAGINVFHEPLAMPDEEWQRCFALDLEGAWHVRQAVLPTMLAKGAGSIVNIASCHSFGIIPHTFPYPVAKHGAPRPDAVARHRVCGQAACG